jgi:pyruvate kinase
MRELRLEMGDQVLFWDPESITLAPSENGALAVPLPGLTELQAKLTPNQGMWFCDGRIRFLVDELHGDGVLAHMVEGTVPLKSSNALFLPDSPSPFTTVTGQDRALLFDLSREQVYPDWLALSLIASPQDVRDSRAEVEQLMGRKLKVMAKFETLAAVSCAEDIINEADGIMVARGDLGLAVGYVRLPEIQEKLVAAARQAGKVSVVATQVMEVFAETGLPQRAELSDLSLIARQQADAVMLGKETVYSPRPIECIRLAKEVLTYESRRFAADQLVPGGV